MKKFCALWMPTEYHKDIVCINREPICQDISDENSKCNLVEITLLDNQDIHIHSKTFNKELTLHFIEKSSNGIFLYEFTDVVICTKDGKIKYFIGEEFPVALYHYIKSFYHTHEHHEDDVDSIMKAFICPGDKCPEIKTLDNEVLMHYLKNYEAKFLSYRKYITLSFNKIEENKKRKRYKYSVYSESYPNMLNLFARAKGEEIYYNSLNHSKYNNSCRIGMNSDFAKTAFNIHNSLKKIKYIEKKMLDDFEIYHNNISYNAAIVFFAVGLILALISMLK